MANFKIGAEERNRQSTDLLLAESSSNDVIPLDIFVKRNYEYLSRVTRALEKGSVLDERV